MHNRKSNINIIFIYIASGIIVFFIGFLVINFVYQFSQDTGQANINKFYREFEKEYKKVHSSYGSMTSEKFTSLPSDVTSVCLMEDTSDCSNTQLNALKNSANIGLLQRKSLLSSKKIGNFQVKGNNNCTCYNLSTSGNIKILFENKRNKVILQRLEIN